MGVRRWLTVGLVAAVTLSGCADKAATNSANVPAGRVAAVTRSGGADKVATISANARAGRAVGGTQTVSVMVGGLSNQIYLPFMLAQRLGYSQAAGLNVRLQDEGAGVDATTQMM